jgi:tight adherence protein B
VNELLLLALVFLATAGVLIGAYVFVNRRALQTSQAALDRLREEEDRAAAKASIRSIIRDARASDLPIFDRILAGKGFTAWVAEEALLAGMEMTAGNFILRCLVGAVAGFLVVNLATNMLPFAIMGAGVGLVLPFFYIRFKRGRRVLKFQDQLPDAIDMLVSSMKAGYSFQAAMRFIGEEIPTPLGPEFMRFYEEQRLGMEVRTALLALQARVPSLDLKMLVTAILIQRETGGNLSEVLEKISTLMRERVALKGEIATLTAESKLSARILSALPLIVFTVVSLLNPGFIKPMLEAQIGPWLLWAAAVSVALGYWWMMKIADIDI